MSEIKVNSIKGVGASTAAITVNNTDGTCTVNNTNRTNKNLVVNGACLIAQRQTSTTSADDYSVDRWKFYHTGTDEAPTCSQADVASGTTPYTLGFRKAFKFLNGNQTSGAGVGDMIRFQYSIEAQDLANSGWNYTSSSSNATLSFWVKSSVAQNFFGRLQASDSSPSLGYAFETGSLTADTWTKVTKTISGATGLAFNNDNGNGLIIEIAAFQGTNFTGSMSLNTWGGFVSGTRTPDNTSTWYTTNDATLEFTGLQLEVGSVATDFEHRSFAVEKRLCMRYFQKYVNIGASGFVPDNTSKSYAHVFYWPVEFRATPTATATNTGSSNGQYIGDGDNTVNISSLDASSHTTQICEMYFVLTGDLTNFRGAYPSSSDSSTFQTTFSFNAEL